MISGLAHLCEFIEDCEHSSLAVRILHLLGREGPRSKQPSRLIHNIRFSFLRKKKETFELVVNFFTFSEITRRNFLKNVFVLLQPCTLLSFRYIRFIYNRVLLECTVVRAAAISALAQFGATCPELLPDILVLLGRCQTDSDDEVRDRATYYYCILTLQQPDLNTRFILEPVQVMRHEFETLSQNLSINVYFFYSFTIRADFIRQSGKSAA